MNTNKIYAESIAKEYAPKDDLIVASVVKQEIYRRTRYES